ncbi:MAG: hypothetical protein KA180_08950 [Gemmatimonadales bacterium]|jgi:hypothetical protein|nr:hypothetical protein [Gemmatimonadales bacterium]
MNQRTSGPNDPVRDYLRRSGASYAVVAQGLRGLVENWERVVAQVLEGYNLTLDDYLNDMDSRQLLANALELAPDEVREAFLPRVHDADVKVRLNLVPAGRCLWGGIVAADEGWTEDANWWYFEQPRLPGPELRRELDAR